MMITMTSQKHPLVCCVCLTDKHL